MNHLRKAAALAAAGALCLFAACGSLSLTPAAPTASQDFTAILNNMAQQNSQLQQKIFEVLQSQINMLAQPKPAAMGDAGTGCQPSSTKRV